MYYDVNDSKSILAPCVLMICLIWDIVVDMFKDYGKVPSWLPGNLFVLNSFTISILNYVDTIGGGLSGESLEGPIKFQLSTDAARLTIYVFVGCILPGIAMSGTRGGWSNIASLFYQFVFYMIAESVIWQRSDKSEFQSKEGKWFLYSGMVLLVGAPCLVLLLGAVMSSGKMGRRLVQYDISEMPFNNAENECKRSERLRRKVAKSWAVVRFWKTEHFICNSAFSPGAAVVVTICVAVMCVKIVCLPSLFHNIRDNEGGNLAYYLQLIFILVGWGLMLSRWFKAAIYCGSSLNKKFLIHIAGSFLAPAVIMLNDFSTRFLLIRLVLFLPLCGLVLAASPLWLFCFVSWYFSALLGSQFARHLYKFDNEDASGNDEYSKYGYIMDAMQLSKDETNIFWMANKKPLSRIRRIMNDASKIEEKCRGLLSIMGDARLTENQRLRLSDPNTQDWIGAVSSIFKKIAHAQIRVDLKDALAAYQETKDVLKFVDCPENIFLEPFNIFGTMNFDRFFKSLSYEIKMYDADKKLKQFFGTCPGIETAEERERVDNLVGCLNSLGKKMFKTLLITPEECSYDNGKELAQTLGKVVGRVIVSGVLEVSDVLLNCTKQWAQNLDEAKMERGIELAGKVSALIERLFEDGDVHLEETKQVPSDGGAKQSKDIEGRDIEAAIEDYHVKDIIESDNVEDITELDI